MELDYWNSLGVSYIQGLANQRLAYATDHLMNIYICINHSI